MKAFKTILWIAILGVAVAAWMAYRPGQAGMPDPQVEQQGRRKILYYVDPMHPAYKSDKPGIAPDCGMKLVPVYADELGGSGAPPGTIRISAQKQQLIGVRFGQVEVRPMRRAIRAVGKVTHDETRIARIHSKIDGWIEQVFVDFSGQLVKKGEPLVSIYSPELFATQQEFLLAARARRELSSSTFQEVAGGGESLYAAARKRLELWDVTEQQIREIEQKGQPQKTLILYAPASGYVIARNAFPRQRVTPETELYSVADHSLIWVIAEVYEYEFPLVKVGQQAAITLPSSPGRNFTGKVSYLYPEMDPLTRTLKARVELPNPEHLLRPEMFANVELTADLGRQLAVPEEAVLDSGAARTVFVDRGDGYFEPRQVELGEKAEGWYIVRKGLKAGERVVTSGNFLMDSESRLRTGTGEHGHD